jgi:hypothetical protein
MDLGNAPMICFGFGQAFAGVPYNITFICIAVGGFEAVQRVEIAQKRF